MLAPRSSPVRVSALLAALLALALGFATVATAATPTPTPTGSPSSGGTSKAKPPTVTFGLGPSNGTGLDGRAGFDYATTPGAVISDHVALVNISAQPLTLLLYGTDAADSSSGALGYEPYAAKHVGASSWLRLPQVNGSSLLVVKARSLLILPFEVQVPSNASPGDHTAGIAVGLVANVVGKSAKNLQLEQRVVTQVLLRVSGTAVGTLAIQKLTASYHQNWNPFGEGSVTLSYVVKNTGNINLGAKQVAKLSGLFGGVGAMPKLPPIPELLPGSSAAYKITVHNVWPEFLLTGKVTVTPVGQPNAVLPTLKATSASTTVWAIPWALIILIVILGVGGYLSRRYLRKRAAARRKPSHSRARNPKEDRNGISDETPVH